MLSRCFLQELIKQIRIGYLESQKDWIFRPQAVECSSSLDKQKFETIVGKQFSVQKNAKSNVCEIVLDFESVKTRYVQVKIRNVAKCPDWHKGAGGRAWLFVDEIFIE